MGSGLPAKYDCRTDCRASHYRSEFHHNVCLSMNIYLDGEHSQENLSNTQ